MKTRLFSWFFALVVLLIVSQHSAYSCPVCFGALDDPATNGMNVAIFTLLGVTGSVLAGFIAFFLRLKRLARAARIGGGEA